MSDELQVVQLVGWIDSGGLFDIRGTHACCRQRWYATTGGTLRRAAGIAAGPPAACGLSCGFWPWPAAARLIIVVSVVDIHAGTVGALDVPTSLLPPPADYRACDSRQTPVTDRYTQRT